MSAARIAFSAAPLGSVLLVALGACAHRAELDDGGPPPPPREFRAAWVATVANIDWPSKPGLPVARQQDEARAILDRLVELNLNAVVLQVRPQADALYASELEPWSSFLGGTQGVAPDPYYDPLEFWIEEAHARGLVLHAWCNPYRANHPANRGGLAPDSIVNRHPELVVKLGSDGYYWMDPTRPEVQDHSVAVVLDIVQRYDVDGIHFDDYFYPYPSYNGGEDFPDDASWNAYQAAGGTATRGDWRRAAVDGFIERLYREIKHARPRVEFGISPFGIWRPGHPSSIRGFDQYQDLYADARRWLREGWVDYFTPQLYWPIAQLPQSFPVLFGWWRDQNLRGRHLWPGTSIGRYAGDAGALEVANQIQIIRGAAPDDPGLCLFSMKTLQSDESRVPAMLVAGPWATPALIPASPWLDATPPEAPTVTVQPATDHMLVSWVPRGDEPAFRWVVAARRGDSWTHHLLPARERSLRIGRDVDEVAVSAVDRGQNESGRSHEPVIRSP